VKAIHTPLVLFVPGLMPKPEPAVHKEALERCFVEGVRRADPRTADSIVASEHAFDLVSWTYDFYREHRDYEIDRAAIDALVRQQRASDDDIAEATAWRRRLTIALYRLGNRLPFLIPHLATERMELHLRDVRRYVTNDDGIADHIREMLKTPLRAAWRSGRPVLLIGHSMGSVIAYDSLWELCHEAHDDAVLDFFLSMGSPLGQDYIQQRIKGSDRTGRERYPTNIARWVNLSAVGDLTALDPDLANDFGEMIELGLIDEIVDERVQNYFRLDGALNVHAEYGYLVNRDAGRIVADWWRRVSGPG
jgi:hypothetical protein